MLLTDFLENILNMEMNMILMFLMKLMFSTLKISESNCKFNKYLGIQADDEFDSLVHNILSLALSLFPYEGGKFLTNFEGSKILGFIEIKCNCL